MIMIIVLLFWWGKWSWWWFLWSYWSQKYPMEAKCLCSQIMQGKAQTGSYMKAIVIRTGFMTTKVGFVLAIFATLLFCYKTLPFPVWHRGSWFMTTKVGFVSLKITSGCQNDQRKCPILEMTNFNHANFDDDLLGGTCTSHLVPPAPRFRLLLRLPQKRQVISQLLDYLAQMLIRYLDSFTPCWSLSSKW